MSVTTVKQITTENGELYYLMAVRKENELDLTLTDCKQAFTGKLNLNEFDDGSEIKYLSLTVSALTEVNTSNSFLYQIIQIHNSNSESILFKWKKNIARNKVILEVWAEVRMNKADMEQTLRSMFSIIVNSLEESSIERNRLQLECERLSNERQKAIESPSHQTNTNKMSGTEIRTEKTSSSQNNLFSDATISQSQGTSSMHQELETSLFVDDELLKSAAQNLKKKKRVRVRRGGKKHKNKIETNTSSTPEGKIQTSLSDPDPENLLNPM